MKYTKGPWKVDELGVITCGIKGTCETVAETMYCRWLNSQAYAAGEPRKDFETAKWCGKQAEVARANGYLIAAAPELYEALKAVESWMDDLSDDYEFQNPFFLNLLENARAALAKAEGGNHEPA